MNMRPQLRPSLWLAAVWMLVCLGAFLMSLQLRSRDWPAAARTAASRPVTTTALPL